MELGGRGGSRVEKSNLGECVKIMTKKLWCYSPNKSQKECARKFVALRWQTKNYHVHSLCVGWRNHAEVTPGMAYKKPKRIRPKIIWLQIPPTLFISSLKKNPAENYMAPDPANFLISSLKKNPEENYMAPDPANFFHQLPQKEYC